MRSKLDLKRIYPQLRELIDSLWREYPGLYNERYSNDPELWIRNIFADDLVFGQALGQDHEINSEQSIGIGIGSVTRAFRELVLGSYANDDALQNPTEWDELDRLITVGNGIDEDNRHDALILFKSGLLKLLNAVKIGKYEHGVTDPGDGTIQYTTEESLQIRHLNAWLDVLTDAPTDTKPYGRQDKDWIEVAALDHDHEIGNMVLIFENNLI